jgi:phage tail-like protein
MSIYHPPVGFHFKVQVLGIPPQDQDLRFSDVAGLSVELGTEEVAEGGENRFVHKFPVRTKYPELVLKRGLLVGSDILTWIRSCVDDLVIEPKSIYVTLLDEQHQPLMTWRLVNAYPTKWSVSDFAASSNAIVVESLQFFYQYFTIDRTPKVA